MAQIILTQLQQALRAVMAAGSEAFGEGVEETGDASRQIALMQSLAMMVGKMADGIEQDDALAHWTRQLLQMLEDNSAMVDAEVPLVMRFCRAVGEMQALLGVPEEGRAWKPELQQKADRDFPLPVRVQDAQGYAKQAGSLVVMFLSTLRGAGLPEAEALCVTAIAERLGTTLEAASSAPTVGTYAERIESANSLLEALTKQMETPSDALWGLVRGIGASLEDAELDVELEAQREAEARAPNEKACMDADYSGSLADLPGVPGARADVALGCAIEIAETASMLLAEVVRMPCDYERPFSRLLKEIKRQAGLVIAACDDDEVTLAELQERAA